MRRIKKGQEPPSLAAWKALANEVWTPTYRILQNPQKRDLHLSLLMEQGFTCCYCGREIGLDDSHIEHFRPRSRYRDLELDYENLHASCLREVHPGTPSICGHLKDERFDEESFLSPLESGIEERFSYTLTGEAVPQDEAAQTMVDALGFNKPFLTSRREEALQGVFDADFLNSATRSEISNIAIQFRCFGEDGKLRSFFHVVARFADELL